MATEKPKTARFSLVLRPSKTRLSPTRITTTHKHLNIITPQLDYAPHLLIHANFVLPSHSDITSKKITLEHAHF
jgi:hypothetical protein